MMITFPGGSPPQPVFQGEVAGSSKDNKANIIPASVPMNDWKPIAVYGLIGGAMIFLLWKFAR